MAISFVASTNYSNGSVGSGAFSISKPSGVTTGDVMIALISIRVINTLSQRTCNPPSGWTLVATKYQSHSFPVQINVMTRTATASEPSSWSGSYSGGSNVGYIAGVTAAYRGVSGVGDGDVASVGSSTSYSTATVTNDSSSNWRIVAAGCTDNDASSNLVSNELTFRKRASYSNPSSYGSTEAMLYDSGSGVNSGNTSRTVSKGSSWHSSASWIAILSATDTAVPGTMSASMPMPTMSASGGISYNATVTVTMPSLPSMTAAGIATPPEGPLGVLVLPTVALSGASHASGTLDVVAAPTMEVVAETRKFGIRVVTPAAESRVVTPRMGAVD